MVLLTQASHGFLFAILRLQFDQVMMYRTTNGFARPDSIEEQWLSAGTPIVPSISRGIFGCIWRHFCASQTTVCGEWREACQTATVTRMTSISLGPGVSSTEVRALIWRLWQHWMVGPLRDVKQLYFCRIL